MTTPFTPGTIAMRCRDMAACIRFYRLLLGDEMAALTGRDQTGMPWHTAWFALNNGGRLVLTDDRSHSHPPAGGGCAHFLCGDPAAEETRLRALGITALMSTHETKSGYALVLADPDGNEIVISTPETLPGLGTKLPFQSSSRMRQRYPMPHGQRLHDGDLRDLPIRPMSSPSSVSSPKIISTPQPRSA